MKTAVSFGKPETGFEEIKGQRHIARPRFPQQDFGPGTNSRLLVTRAGPLGSAGARRLSL
jgi:hypothetical protein